MQYSTLRNRPMTPRAGTVPLGPSHRASDANLGRGVLVRVPAARIVFSDEDRAEVATAVGDVLATGVMTLGPRTQAFEQAFAAAHGAAYGVAVSSGTAALEIILRCVDVSGGEVIVPTNTFAATAFAVLGAGGQPVFADVDAATFAVNAATVAPLLGPRTKAVVLVHIGGVVPADVGDLRALCDDAGIPLVEDAAHAHGSALDGRHAGTFGIAGAFSFYPTKIITSGEGGMILTADGRLRDEARMYRDQGKATVGNNVHVRVGYAWRMSELHAATGLVHLRRLPEFLAVRRRVAAYYDATLDDLDGVDRVPVPPTATANYYKYLALPRRGVDRAQFKKLLQQHDVALAGEVYEMPLHRQPVFERYATGPLPVADDVCARHVCLPVLSDMTENDAIHVIAAVQAALDSLTLNG